MTTMVSSSAQHLRQSSEEQKNASRSEPRPKASRYRNSCDACQAAKIKCGQQKPECHRCTAQEIQCVYSLSRRMGRPRQPARTANQPAPPQRTQHEVCSEQVANPSPTSGTDVTMGGDVITSFTPGKKVQASPQPQMSTPLEHDPRLMPMPMDLFQPTGISFIDDFDFATQSNDLGFPDLGAPDFSDMMEMRSMGKNSGFFSGAMDQHQLPSPEMSLSHVNLGTPTHRGSSHAEGRTSVGWL